MVRSGVMVFLLLSLVSQQFIQAQSWRFPDCSELEVVALERSSENTNETRITVYNDCENCSKHVYTGMKIYIDDELVALDKSFETEADSAGDVTIPNTASGAYILRVETDVETFYQKIVIL